MEKHPIFLNVSRGGSVDEAALVRALDNGLIRAAGPDVLEAEKPDLEKCALIGRENVILTPHAAFYSARSIEALQRMSFHNLTDCLTGNRAPCFQNCQRRQHMTVRKIQATGEYPWLVFFRSYAVLSTFSPMIISEDPF